MEPERVEPEYDEPFEVEPVHIELQVSAEAFEAICCQITDTDSQHRVTLANVTLVGASLPEPEDGIGLVYLKNLDVSEQREYAIGRFEVHGGYIDCLRGRMRPIERAENDVYGASIRILITQAHYDFSAESGRAHSISCEGRVIGSQGECYDRANVAVSFLTHLSSERFYGESERSFFGEFSYSPEREHFPIQFSFNLWYISESDCDLLATLLTRGANTHVFMMINIINEKAELLAATEQLRGNVRNYSFEVFRTLVEIPE